DLHGADPIDAERMRVRSFPQAPLGDELARIPLVGGQPIGLAQSDEVMAAAELPRHLDVPAARVRRRADPSIVLRLVEAMTALEIEVPIDRGREARRARA